MEFTKEEVKLIKGIFKDCAAYEYIDYDNDDCPYKALYEKIMDEQEIVNEQEIVDK